MLLNTKKKKKMAYNVMEKIVGKGENVCYQYFLLFPHFFSNPFFLGASKVLIIW